MVFCQAINMFAAFDSSEFLRNILWATSGLKNSVSLLYFATMNIIFSLFTIIIIIS